ncbi:MAG: contractile injection system tape measure protein [Bacteroidota bacterium]
MHFIGKLTFDLQYEGRQVDGWALQKEAAQFCNGQLIDALENRLDQLLTPAQWLVLSTLEIDIGTVQAPIDWNDLQQRITTSIMEAVSNYMIANEAESTPITSRFAYTVEKWLQFLQTGELGGLRSAMPHENSHEHLIEAVASESVHADALTRVLSAEPVAILRLVRQYSPDFLGRLGAALTGLSFEAVEAGQGRLESQLKKVARFVHDVVDESKSASKSALQRAQEKQLSEALLAIQRALASFAERYWLLIWQTVVREKVLPDERHLLAEVLAYATPVQTRIFIASLLEQHKIQVGIDKTVWSEFLDAYTKASVRDEIPVKNATRFSEFKDLHAKEPVTDDTPADNPTRLPEYKDAHAKASVTDEMPADNQAEKETEIPASAPQQKLVGESSGGEEKNQLPENQVDRLADDNDFEESIQLLKLHPHSVPAEDSAFWYVENAGIILLHPFLSPLFEQLELIRGDKFPSQKKRELAIHLLRYLSTQEHNVPEYALTFEKFLCAWPENEPINRNVHISAQVVEECKTLLQAVIQHWSQLGKTSPDTLRDAFLRRPGKLSYQTSNGWLLQVEQTSVDVLLQYLPWGVGVVKLPWMEDLLRVEWSS